MSGKTVTAQARTDPMPVAGQRPGPPFFAILIVAGLIVIGAGLRSAANIIAASTSSAWSSSASPSSSPGGCWHSSPTTFPTLASSSV